MVEVAGTVHRKERARRIGMITPSSNTCLEPMTYRILGSRDDVTVHSTRVAVTHISLDATSDRQFGLMTMSQAAELLATADVDVIAWNGTSGSWLGVDHDRALVAEITRATGVPATTSTLAMLDAFERFGLSRVTLATPYLPAVNEQIVSVFAACGIEVDGSLALGLTDNESFAGVTPDELRAGSIPLVARRPDALIFLCTNLWGAPVVGDIERETGVPVLDSVATTLWRCLELAGAPLLDPRWGALLA
jgi:maleate isomerase